MSRFWRFIGDEELCDMYMHGRRYTWSSERDTPTLVRNDRILCTSRWEIAHPHCLLHCLSSATFDHCPLNPTTPETDPFQRLVARLKATARHLQRWSARTIGGVSLQLQVARELIARLDAAQDFRPLSLPEMWLRRKLKGAYLGLASLERSIKRQRSRISWLRDSPLSYLSVHASRWKQRNLISSLRVDDHLVTEHAAMAEATFNYFSGVLGSSDEHAFSLDQSLLHATTFDLSDLETPITEEEIWRADIIKHDICEAFDKLYTANGRGFQKLNEALLTLLPKRPDAAPLSAYCPISLINLIAKLFAKTARLLHNLKVPRMLLELDIARAFDSVSWPFLLETLQHLGFGQRWRDWISILLATASTRVMLNGHPVPPIDHACDLR
ncbi:uncharacterized protein [Aegilops tauschii subsp. strangulata]|uniref:uncharacterized protein n=1 Tax=Aegilops tauschii subsp. strangulata TaxID=200361 RepID=UPI003CC8AD0E